MAEERIIRRLAAVLAADVAGYSRLMGRDEAGTLSLLKAHRTSRLEPLLVRHGGRLVKLTGDGVLAEFTSAVEAVSAAIAFQQSMLDANRDQPGNGTMSFRIGVHLGDLIVEGDDLYGDGVNVAARLEAEAPPGGIIVSRTVQEAVDGRIPAAFDDGGERALKNIERPMQVFVVRWNAADWREPLRQPSAPAVVAPRLVAPPVEPVSLVPPDRPSIAVLPFQNMSSDAEQEYFADGTVEDIITALSRFRSLFVIARNSSFVYKGRAVDVRQVGRDLGVRYVLEGSVRKSANRVRITAQLVDSESGAHHWADRFDGAVEDIFDLQDRITEQVITALMPRIERVEIARMRRKPAERLDAYDSYLRGLALSYPITRDTIGEAMRLFRHAIDLDPGYAPPYGMLVACFANRLGFGGIDSLEADREEVTQFARIAVQAGADDALTLGHAAWAIGYVLRDLSRARQWVERAQALNPNLSTGWANSGWIHLWEGNAGAAIEQLQRAWRLDPLYSASSVGMRSGLAHACFFLDRYDEAIAWAEHQLRENPNAHPPLRIALASAGMAGRSELAQSMRGQLLRVDPTFRISRLALYLGPYPPEYLAKYAEGLRRAGVAE